MAKGADPSHLDSKNRPDLSLVLFNDYLDEVKIGSLVEASKAVLNTKDVFGNFPLSYAVLTQSSQTVAHIAHFSSLETVQYVVEQLTHSSIIVPDDFITPNNGIPISFLIQFGLGPKKKKETKETTNVLNDSLVLRSWNGKLSC